MTNAEHARALHAITQYDKRNKLPLSGLAIMMEALSDAKAEIEKGRDIEETINDYFNMPLARRIIRAING